MECRFINRIWLGVIHTIKPREYVMIFVLILQVYEEIANHFSGTRHTPWPKISQFIKDMPAGSMMADIGCGNGKYLGLNKSIFEVQCNKLSALAPLNSYQNICQVHVYQQLAYLSL